MKGNDENNIRLLNIIKLKIESINKKQYLYDHFYSISKIK